MTTVAKQFYRCECFATHNIFLAPYRLHVKYFNERQFWEDYNEVLVERGMKDRGRVLALVQGEVKRRLGLEEDVTKIIETVKSEYRPLYPQIFQYSRSWCAPGFLDLADRCRSGELTKSMLTDKYLSVIGEDVYMVEALSPTFCEMMLEELDNFNARVLQKSRPNTMNRSGVMVEELGLLDFVNDLIAELLAPISLVLYPEWCGDDGLDSHKSFTLKYALKEDTELAYHYDNAEVTFNFCLGRDFSGAEVYFTKMTGEPEAGQYMEAEHVPGHVLIHRARHMHGTKPLLSGSRYNILTWLRSSSLRNSFCPMCRSKPRLTPSVRMGDGFTV